MDKKRHNSSGGIDKIYNNGQIVPLPSYPENGEWFHAIVGRFSNSDCAMLHAQMIHATKEGETSSSSITGSWQVAGWISKVLTNITSNSQSIQHLESLGVPTKKTNEVIVKLASLKEAFTFLQRTRDLTRLMSSIRRTGIYKNHQLKPVYMHTFLAILSRLKTDLCVVLPADYWYLQEHQIEKFAAEPFSVKPIAHATVMVIQKEEKTNLCKYNLIETEGANSKKISFSDANKKRLELTPRDKAQALHQKKFKPDDFSSADEKSNPDELASSSEQKFIFSRCSATRAISSLTEKFSGDITSTQETELTLIVEILWLNFSRGFSTFKGMAGHQKELMAYLASKISPIFEDQTLRKAQENGRCELASATVAADLLLDDPTSYQTLMALLIENAVNSLQTSQKYKNHRIITALQADLSDRVSRIKSTSFLEKNP